MAFCSDTPTESRERNFKPAAGATLQNLQAFRASVQCSEIRYLSIDLCNAYIRGFFSPNLLVLTPRSFALHTSAKSLQTPSLLLRKTCSHRHAHCWWVRFVDSKSEMQPRDNITQPPDAFTRPFTNLLPQRTLNLDCLHHHRNQIGNATLDQQS